MSSVRSLLVLILPFAMLGALWYVAYQDSASSSLPKTMFADAEVRSMHQRALQAANDAIGAGTEEGPRFRSRFTLSTSVDAREESN